MKGREPCKKARDVSSIKELGLSAPAERLIEGMSPEDVILSVRNYEIYKFIPRCDIDGSDTARLVDEIEKVVEYQGFLRDDVRDRVSEESHFVDRYVVELGLMGTQLGRCMPFYSSNEIYETYIFSDERIERILNLLEPFLTKKQLRAVRSDLIHPYPRKGAIVREAKKAMAENREPIREGLFKIFA
ncbi:hypothetical protein IKF20_00855 [Candidatus Saccharibacteria bacterium]|nr:hypothetical protein [Candidatus Saccharibacteria bacterium]